MRSGDFTDQQKEQILRDQHRLVLDAIREGRSRTCLDRKDCRETLAAVKELDLQWLNADSVHSENSLIMQLRVTEGGTAVRGARLTFRFARPDAAPFYTQVATIRRLRRDESGLRGIGVAGRVGAGAGELRRTDGHEEVPFAKGRVELWAWRTRVSAPYV